MCKAIGRLVLLSAVLYGTDAGRLSLHASAEQGLVEPLKVAIKGRYDEEREEQIKPDIDGQNKKGRVALHLAACNWRGDLEPVLVVGVGAHHLAPYPTVKQSPKCNRMVPYQQRGYPACS
jgi:hypothetical protein